ncbi:MAG: hypothetical protein IJ519_00230 [Clostridia bacterium]|nr:hypothetical protein [Clostridia bacterium]
MNLHAIFREPLFVLLAVIVFLALAVWAAVSLHYFQMELRYLNNEISRTDGAEREMWKRRRRRLWLSLIPFVRY